jgi:class 3 adenylate cyclase
VSVPAGIRRLCVAYDVEGYSTRSARDQIEVQERLAAVLGGACAQAGLAAGDFLSQEQGDGGLILLPTGSGVDEPLMIARFLAALEAGLAALNRNLIKTARIRMRVVLVEGVVFAGANGYVGDAVVAAFRMCDAPPVRRALAAAPEASLAVVVSDGLYHDVVRHGHHGLPGARFTRQVLDVKEFSQAGWLYVGPGEGPVPAAPGREPSQAGATQPGDGGHPLLSSTLDAEGPHDGW